MDKLYVADFETCDAWESVDGEVPDQRVWLAGLKNLATLKTELYTSLDDFMKAIFSRRDNCNREIAFHNLKFDGSFIVPWLLNNGYTVSKNKPNKGEFSILIDDMNNWYNITIQVTSKRKVTIWDSLKLFPTQLEYMHQIYGTPTKKLHEDEEFYTRLRLEGHDPTEEEIKYMENDLQVLAETIIEHIKYEGMNFKKTQASQAFHNFTKHFEFWKYRFPGLETKDDLLIRPAYWGGISYVNEDYQGKDLYNINVYDINSSYPYQLAYQKLPYGHPVLKLGPGMHPDMSKFWIAEVLISFDIKKDRLPCIPTKAITENKPITNTKWLKHSQGIVRMRFCCIDYYNIKDSYDFEIISWEWSIHFAWKVQKEIQSYILQNNEDKIKYSKLAKKEKDPVKKKEYLARSQRAKINNNAFYGKFGEQVIKKGKTPHLNADGSVDYRLDREDEATDWTRKYLPVAIATTAWGRRQLVLKANMLGKYFIYCDTDSIHFLEEGQKLLDRAVKRGELKVDPVELGAWDFEGSFDRGRFLRPKCYYEENIGETPQVTLAGLPADPHTGARSKQRSVITWENFHIGLKIPKEQSNKLASQRTRTGNKLIPVEFNLTPENSLDFNLIYQISIANV